jgi:hypothetical protein
MTITYSVTTADTGTFKVGTPLALAAFSVIVDDIIVVCATIEDDNDPGTLTPSNSGTAFTWNLIADTGNNASGNCRVAAWWAKASASQSNTVSLAWTSGSNHQIELFAIVHTGAHLTTPCPAGKVYSGISGTDVSQSITPSASGSALWMAAAGIGNASTFAAAANCTAIQVGTPPDNHSCVLIRPTTQPRADGSAFTLGETDTGDTVAWLAFEVQAASTQSNAPRAMFALTGVG